MILNILSYSISIEKKKNSKPVKRISDIYRIEKALEEVKYRYLYNQNL